MGGTTRRVTGPMEPMTTDQKYAGLSRAAQRQYLRGAAQKRGEVDMVAAGEASRGRVCGRGVSLVLLALEESRCQFYGSAFLGYGHKRWDFRVVPSSRRVPAGFESV